MNNLFGDHPDGQDAKNFLSAFGTYCHAIDDIVDEKITEAETVAQPFLLSLQLFSSNFYRKYQQDIYPVIRIIHHSWLDSVQMEKSNILWQQEQADVLKSSAVELFLLIIELLGGYQLRRDCAVAVRENAYKLQHKDLET